MNGKKNKGLNIRTNSTEYIASTVIIVMITLVLGLNMFRTYKNYIVAQSSDSKPLNYLENIDPASGNIVLSLDQDASYPMLEVYINGRFIRKFDENREIKIEAGRKDIIQINGAMYQEPIRIRIEPRPMGSLKGQQIIIDSKLVTLDIVRN